MVIAKNGSGRVYWPALGINSIGDMNPGEGYQLYMSAAATLTYPANALGKQSIAAGVNHYLSQHYVPTCVNTGHTAVLGVNGGDLQDGDEVSAWDQSGRLISAGAIYGGRSLLVLFGDDPFTEDIKEGPAENQPLYLIIWRRESDEEIISADWSIVDGLTAATMNGQLKYRTDAVYIAQLISAEPAAVYGYRLETNYPNPFNPETTLRFELPRASHVSLEILNTQGQVTRTLVNEERAAGKHSLIWNGRDDNGQPAATGIYLVRMSAGDFHRTMKIAFIK
jgi:hypothetical protein